MDSTHQALRDEIKFLGEQLGIVIQKIEGNAAFEQVEEIRHLARSFRQGGDETRQQLVDAIRRMRPRELRVVIRAFTIFMYLANLAEDRHRLRVLRHRERDSQTGIRSQSIAHALTTLRESGSSAQELLELIRQIDVELVFTAHPTEAKRRSVRAKLRQIRKHLAARDIPEALPREIRTSEDRIQNELIKLWQTDLVRPRRPTVMQEVGRGLSIKHALWETIPPVFAAFREALGEESEKSFGVPLHYGSWIGGDRDGHPYVTVEMTDQTIRWLKSAALDFHRNQCERLRASLSFSSQYSTSATKIREAVSDSIERWPALEALLEDIPESELFRRWLIIVGWRLDETFRAVDQPTPLAAQYGSATELLHDVTLIKDSLSSATNALAIEHEVQPWLDRIAAFGFHLARLDIRQDSRIHLSAVNELLTIGGACESPEDLSEEERCALVERIFHDPLLVDETELTPETRDVVSLFRWLASAVESYGYSAFGGYVISMTRQPSDMLNVLWLWEFSRQNDETCLPIVPLFETISDLRIAEQTFERALGSPIYQSHVAHWGDEQIVMLGYSDGTKDGGYLAACWALFDAQRRISEVADAHSLKLTFFHGRGGSLGRGGGPAARSILALPRSAFHGSLRLTEQGEVLAERYDDPKIAHRHLEQILWASLMAAGDEAPAVKESWTEMMQTLATASRSAYRELIDHEDFVRFFRTTTPLDAIEALPIGSRPSRRKTSSGLDGLRAIPFVFSWTQCRWLVPAWFGFGTAVHAQWENSAESRATLETMYERWAFFRAIVDNAVLALAKADESIATWYAQLAEGDEGCLELCEKIRSEFHRTQTAVLEITRTNELLDKVVWLKESIQVRNYYVDPINMIQVELLRRIQAGEDLGDAEDIDSLLHLTRLTINGVASGMRTTG